MQSVDGACFQARDTRNEKRGTSTAIRNAIAANLFPGLDLYIYLFFKEKLTGRDLVKLEARQILKVLVGMLGRSPRLREVASRGLGIPPGSTGGLGLCCRLGTFRLSGRQSAETCVKMLGKTK